MGGSLDRCAAEIDGRGVCHAVQLDLLPHERTDVVRCDAHIDGRSARAGDVPTEARPIPALLPRLRESG